MANCTALSVSLGEKKPSCSLKFSITSNSKIKVPAEIPSALILCCGSPNPKPPTQWTIRMLFHGTALYLGRKELGCEVGAAEIGGVREVRAFPVKQGEVTLKPSLREGGQVALHQQQQECSWATGPAVSTMPSAAQSSPHARVMDSTEHSPAHWMVACTLLPNAAFTQMWEFMRNFTEWWCKWGTNDKTVDI